MSTPSPKRVLAFYFSQTGQLQTVLNHVLAPLRASAFIEVESVSLTSTNSAPFPWPVMDFFDAFPETVLQKPQPLQTVLDEIKAADLVILAFPVWFLSPPPAITAFLQHPQAARLLAGKPVVTLIACRNMWLMAQDSVKHHLRRLGAVHCDHIVLTDQSGTFASFITTPRWLLTGRKNAFWGLPPAGIADAEMAGARRFGIVLSEALAADLEQSQQPLLRGLSACRVDARLYASEKVGLRSFTIWGKLLHRLGRPGTWPRRLVLCFYIVFLLCLIVTVVPLTMMIKALLRPLLKTRLAALQAAYEQPSGSASDRLARFTQMD